MAGISNSGYQLVVSAGVPQPLKDQVPIITYNVSDPCSFLVQIRIQHFRLKTDPDPVKV
jgi:hypothetical protein